MNRRAFVAGMSALAAHGVLHSVDAAALANTVAVLCPLPPDPAPPGVADFAAKEISVWEAQNSTSLNYEPVAWSNLRGKMSANFSSGAHVHDVIYMSSWIPEFADYLMPLDKHLPRNVLSDLPRSFKNTVTWDGDLLGVTSTLSLLTLYYNTRHFEAAGIDEPPATWDDLKRVASELTRDGRYGWRMNYGAPAGIGGSASYWMTFLQQAGGGMYDEQGQPVFDSEAGVDALQLLVDLLPSSDPESLRDTSIVDVTAGLGKGSCSMAFGWPFMWRALQADHSSKTAGQFATALLPAGPTGTASLDGSDAWTIAANSPVKELSVKLIELFLDKDVQKAQALATGWLPIRQSLYADEQIQSALPHATTLHEQAKHPYDSFVTPDYLDVTTAIGDEILAALSGQKTAAEAISDASGAVSSIVAHRGK